MIYLYIKNLFNSYFAWGMAYREAAPFHVWRPSVTNEEIAVCIQNGNRKLYEQLWECVKGLVILQARRFYNSHRDICQKARVELDDLTQEGYFSLCEAVKAYTPAAGYQFTTYLRYPLKNRFRQLVGLRTKAGRMALQNISIDAPLKDEESTFADITEDEAAAAALEDVESRIFNEQLRQELSRCLDMLPDSHAEAVRTVYYQRTENADICQLARRGIRELRRGRFRKTPGQYREFIISAQAYRQRNPRARSTKRAGLG